MIVVLGIDGLEYDCVEGFGCANLAQESCGTTDLSEFTEPRTVVIWSSFLAGRNLEKQILASKDLWGFRLKFEDTFFSRFRKPFSLDVPGYSHDAEQHRKERDALKAFFAKEMGVEEYDRIALEWHRKVKGEFFRALERDYDLVMGYFDAIDIVGHLSFGVEAKMRALYAEFDEIAGKARSMNKGPVLIISDHGMKTLGSRYGDHSDHGFWSLNSKEDLGRPKPTDFYRFVTERKDKRGKGGPTSPL